MHPLISQVKTALRNTLSGISGFSSSCVFASEGSTPSLPVSGKILVTEKYDTLSFVPDNETDHALSGKLCFTFFASPEDFNLLQTVLASAESAFLSSSGNFGTNGNWTIQSFSRENAAFKDGFFRAVCKADFQARLH